jgi:hypothetical protein
VNWQAIGAIGEVVAAFGVVVSLVFLSMELRRNTRSVRASSSFEAQHSIAEITESVTQNPLVFPIALRIWNEDISLADLNAEDRAAFSLFCRGLYMRCQAMFFLNMEGQIDDELWISVSTVLRGNLQYKAYREWWETEKANGLMVQGFVDALESMEGVVDDPFRVGLRDDGDRSDA